jgi:hypothetical protein
MKTIATFLLGSALCIIPCLAQHPQQQEPLKTGQVGLYQIVMHQGEMPRLNTFLLDTVTGKTWMMVSFPDGSNVWEFVDKVDNDAEEAALARKHQKAPDKQ